MSSLYDEWLREQYAKERAPRKGGSQQRPCCAAPKKIVLCGSTRFFAHFRAIELKLTVAGHLVMTVIDTSEFDALPKQVVKHINAGHLRKIDACDEVLVINRDGYIGKDTQREIEYAHAKGKKVSYHWPKQHNDGAETRHTKI